MEFFENGTSGRPALALVAIRAKKSRCVEIPGRAIGDIRAVRLIAQSDAAGYNAARQELIDIVSIGGGIWSNNWRIAEGMVI